MIMPSKVKNREKSLQRTLTDTLFGKIVSVIFDVFEVSNSYLGLLSQNPLTKP
jgi:hypothetical protein